MLTRPSPTSRGLGRFVSFRMGRWWKLTAAGPRAGACPLRRFFGGGDGEAEDASAPSRHTPAPRTGGAAVPPASAFGSVFTRPGPTSRGLPPAAFWGDGEAEDASAPSRHTPAPRAEARRLRLRDAAGRARWKMAYSRAGREGGFAGEGGGFGSRGWGNWGIGGFGDLGIWGFGNLGIRSLAWGQGSVSPRAAMLAPQAARAAAENKPLVRLVRKYASAHRRPPFPVPAIHPCCRPPRRRRGHGGFPARPIFRAAHPRCPPTPPFAPLCAFAPSHRIQFNVSSHIFPPVVL